jgi:hypothetical protein
MYKVCESLREAPFEIGRVKAYAPGWIENESIYTHMEFKWMLEILRSGLYDEFFQEMRTIFPPFMPPEVYGRSTLENSSFIVSSAFPDPELHGQAFQPRLSGVTAEILEIWTLMTAGQRPFRMSDSGELQLKLEPSLPGWLFTEAPQKASFWDLNQVWKEIEIPSHCFAFRFLGHTLVVYHNPERSATYGEIAASVRRCTFLYRNGSSKTLEGAVFEGELALHVRDGRVERMDLILGT